MERKFIIWFVSNVALQIGGPILFYFYLSGLLDYEYAHGIRTSTDGDNIIIPVLGMVIFIFFSLVVINIIIACFCFWVDRKNSPES